MINPILPTPTDLSEDPELAILVTLLTNLDMTRFALLATYPDLENDLAVRGSHTEQDAYASAILNQVIALTATVEEYIEATQRLRSLSARKPSAKDIPF